MTPVENEIDITAADEGDDGTTVHGISSGSESEGPAGKKGRLHQEGIKPLPKGVKNRFNKKVKEAIRGPAPGTPSTTADPSSSSSHTGTPAPLVAPTTYTPAPATPIDTASLPPLNPQLADGNAWAVA